MALQTGLLRRGRRYFIRRKVPADLIPLMQKREIKYALKTSDPKEAKRLASVEWLKIEADFETLRKKVHHDAPPKLLQEISESQRLILVAKWAREIERASVKEFDGLFGKLEPEEKAEIEYNHIVDEVSLTGGNDQIPANDASGRLDRLLEREGLALAKDSDSYRFLKVCLRKVLLENVRRDQQRLRGEPLPSFHEMKFVSQSPPLIAPENEKMQSRAQNKCTLGELLTRYMEEKQKAGVSKATIRAYSIPVGILQDILGASLPLSQITRDTMSQLRDSLRALPVNARQKYKGKSLDVVLELTKDAPNVKRLDDKTAGNYFHFISAIFNYAVECGLMDQNPAKGRSFTFKTKRKKGGKPVFETAELNKLFRAPLYTGCKDDEHGFATRGPNRPQRGRYWVPLLALFHGLRLNEACQLYTEDVRVVQNVPCLLIREFLDEGGESQKNLKTRSSERTIPIHPQILKLGFLAFVDHRRRNPKDARLFPELPQGKAGYFSDPFSKWFGRFLQLTLGHRSKATFHSFRHMFRDALRDADVSTERAEALGGWTSQRSEEAGYGKGFTMPALLKEIEKVRYEGLDISHLSEALPEAP